MTVGLTHYLALSALLFCIGATGVLIRKNAIIVFMCVELMLNGANLAVVAFSRFIPSMNGHGLVFFVMAVAAAEAAVGLAIFINMARTRDSLYLDEFRSLKG